jgi:hypothetical protein
MTNKTETSIVGSSVSTLILDLIFLIIAFFVYGESIPKTLGFGLFLLLFYFASFLMLIPFVGFIIEGFVVAYWIVPFVFNLTGLTQTWLISLVFWLNIGLGGIVSIIFGIIVLAALS